MYMLQLGYTFIEYIYIYLLFLGLLFFIRALMGSGGCFPFNLGDVYYEMDTHKNTSFFNQRSEVYIQNICIIYDSANNCTQSLT